MANTLQNPTAFTRQFLSVLHQKLNFIGTINRQYDSQFAQSGAKIGASLNIRKPVEFEVTDGAVMNAQDVTEEFITLTVNNRKHIGMNFTMQELTMNVDDFTERYIEPAAARLAAKIESDVLQNIYLSVYNEISNVGGSIVAKDIGRARKVLVDSLAPMGDQMYVCMNTTDNLELVDVMKAQFNDTKKIGAQNLDGYVSRSLGFNFMENTHMPTHTTGTDDGTGDYLVNQASVAEGASSITVDTGAGTWAVGDIFTFDDVKDVHPETKVTRPGLKRFVVTAATGTSATTISFSPAMYATGARQNVSAMPAENAPLRKRESDESTAIGNAADYLLSLAYHRDAFTFATADLQMPRADVWKAREVMDGISMRVVSGWDVVNDAEPVRIDILYGYKTLRPEWACRLGFN
jgi:hypothetical protein